MSLFSLLCTFHPPNFILAITLLFSKKTGIQILLLQPASHLSQHHTLFSSSTVYTVPYSPIFQTLYTRYTLKILVHFNCRRGKTDVPYGYPLCCEHFQITFSRKILGKCCVWLTYIKYRTSAKILFHFFCIH